MSFAWASSDSIECGWDELNRCYVEDGVLGDHFRTDLIPALEVIEEYLYEISDASMSSSIYLESIESNIESIEYNSSEAVSYLDIINYNIAGLYYDFLNFSEKNIDLLTSIESNTSGVPGKLDSINDSVNKGFQESNTSLSSIAASSHISAERLSKLCTEDEPCFIRGVSTSSDEEVVMRNKENEIAQLQGEWDEVEENLNNVNVDSNNIDFLGVSVPVGDFQQSIESIIPALPGGGFGACDGLKFNIPGIGNILQAPCYIMPEVHAILAYFMYMVTSLYLFQLCVKFIESFFIYSSFLY